MIALFSVRSERQFCEQLRYNLLFKWFLDLNVEDEPFNATTFSKNRERLLEAEVARAFFTEVVAEAGRRRLLSDEHFSVDGTLLEAWASLKSYRPLERVALHSFNYFPPDSPGGAGYVLIFVETDRPTLKGGAPDPDARVVGLWFAVAAGSLGEELLGAGYRFWRDGIPYEITVLDPLGPTAEQIAPLLEE